MVLLFRDQQLAVEDQIRFAQNFGPLGAIAGYKALYELVLKPFFWDKTMHGLSLAVAPPPPPVGAGSDQGAKFP